MSYRSLNPATGETVREFADISDADLHTALQAAQTAYRADWRQRPAADRAHIMKAAAAELRANAAEYAGYITAEMGKLIGTSEAEVGLSAAILDYYADRAETFLAPKQLPESPGAVVETEPIGVIHFGSVTCLEFVQHAHTQPRPAASDERRHHGRSYRADRVQGR